MFRLLQRMDETQPRHAEGGSGAALRVLKPVTVLADADETETEALESWARGLDWVQWLFSSVRQRLEHLHLEPAASAKPQDAWRAFAESAAQGLSAHLIQAWVAAEEGHLEALLRLDQSLAGSLTNPQGERSQRAGELLLRSTRGARYQGVLGRYRDACNDGRTPGHFLTVWAAVGHFFQLSVANVVAEFLRLEWTMMARGLTPVGEPQEPHSIVTITSRLLQESRCELKLMSDEAPLADESRAEATPS